ncbi:metallophosphoesterase family protein [Haloarculaceae archaeon H-GB2-1]|nr:metallophosphoesterase family protein [Haloarculaceae archaeon H-GB1-1]MEA5386359.1 metallophosphoesterase family protein [Haloarculaceae archaeon H-GB11]MEA5407864.1 metallophosphoesterase family protein [Haloarculaceae archaeon H-GB2-1]
MSKRDDGTSDGSKGDVSLRFSETVEAHHERIDVDEWDRTYVVGDVHGCPHTLDRLLEEIDPSDNDLVLFVGDLVRKGPDSHAVVETVRERDNFSAVRGNNEQKIIDGRKTVDELTDADREYIESLPVVISWDDGMVVHGGIDVRKPLSEHTVGELLNMRSLAPEGGYERPFWFEQQHEHPRVFFGHTVMARPFATDSAVGLDTGAVYGGKLTAYDCLGDEFISVDPVENYESRSDDSIVTPNVPVRC